MLSKINVHKLPRFFVDATSDELEDLYLEAHRAQHDAFAPAWLRTKARCIMLYFDHVCAMHDFYEEKEQDTYGGQN